MGRLSTHVLDTANGRPAPGMAISLHRVNGERHELVLTTRTNSDGRTDAPLLTGEAMAVGIYVITFHVRAYYEGLSPPTACPFLDEVPIRFTIFDADGHYHVPLLCTPWSFSTYRGS